MKYALIDEEGNLSEKGEVLSPVAGIENFVDTVAGVYEKFADRIEGVAISIPGAIDSESGYARTTGAFLDLYGQNIFDLLKERIPVPLAVENDGKCAALAEVWKGGLSDCQDGIVVILGTGIAGGIVKNRRLHKGKNFTAGELSCLMVKPNDFSMQNIMCIPGAMMGLTMAVAAAKGVDLSTLETAALQKNASEKVGISMDGAFSEGTVAKNESSEKAAEEAQPKIDGPQIFKWLEEGDPVVTGIYQNFISHLALMTYNLQVVYDPEKIIFGGGVSRQERLVPDIRAEVNKIFEALGSLIPVLKPELGNCQFLSDANMVGAMYNYLIHHKPELAK